MSFWAAACLECEMLNRVLLAIVFALLLGCISTGEKYSFVSHKDSGKALILVYRPAPPADILLTHTYAYVHSADLYLGERKLAPLPVNAFTYLEVEPGPQSFSIRENLTGGVLRKLEFDARPGRRYYLRYIFRMSLITELDFRVVPNEVGEKEIQQTRLIAIEG